MERKHFRKCIKSVQPGNQFVTIAKQYASQNGVAIDMPAGPSELLVYADESANPKFVASDLFSQAEHGKDSQVILVTTNKNILNDVEEEVYKQLKALPRQEIAQVAIHNSKLIYVETEQTALDLINEYHTNILLFVLKTKNFLWTKLKMQVRFSSEIIHQKVQEIMLLEPITPCQQMVIQKVIAV